MKSCTCFAAIGLVLSLAGTAAAGSFTPLTVNGIRMWLDASSLVGYTNMARVHYWNDSSTNNVDMGTMFSRYGNSANRSPHFVTNVLGGRPVLRFDPYEADLDGRDGMYSETSFATGGVAFAFSQPGTLITLYNRWDTNATYISSPTWEFGPQGDTTKWYLMHHVNGLRADVSPYQYFINAPQTNGLFSLDTVTMEGTNILSHYYRNGASFASGKISNSTSLGNLALANKPNTAVPSPVDYAEVIAYTRVLNTEERNAVDFYEEMKYGISNSAAGVMLTPTLPANTFTSGGTLNMSVQQLDVPNAARGTIAIATNLCQGNDLTIGLDLEVTSGTLDAAAYRTWLDGLSNTNQFYTVSPGAGDFEVRVTFSAVTSSATLYFDWDTANPTTVVDRVEVFLGAKGTIILIR